MIIKCLNLLTKVIICSIREREKEREERKERKEKDFLHFNI